MSDRGYLRSDAWRQIGLHEPELGSPIVREIAIESAAFWDRTAANRDTEVCMVVCRPSGRLLTFKKTFYPPTAFRLMTGGVEPDETILHALLREVHEETGLEVTVRRFLALALYRAEGEDVEGPPRFATFAFLLDETGGSLGATDAEERVEAFREIDASELGAVACWLEALPDSRSEDFGVSWREWGRFRAVIHRLVDEALQSHPGCGQACL